MSSLKQLIPRSAATAALVFTALTATAWAADLSLYRGFALGSSLSAVAKQTGAKVEDAKVTQSRPALIQVLAWRPQTLSASTQTEPAQDVTFTFYNGELSRILVSYDRYETEGLTPNDITEAFSATFGVPERPTGASKVVQGAYGDQEELVARWEDAKYRFELIQASFGPSYRLVGVLKRLEAPAKASILEAARLDEKEAPQREAAQKLTDGEIERAKLEKARLVNKPKFRP